MAESATAGAHPIRKSLYEKRQKIYPREVHGWFAMLRVTAVLALLGLFYILCWLRWEGRQLLLFDLPGRKFHIFTTTFYPQDFLYLTFLLILAALALFFFTSLAGRLWCGYACPQTVYTELFLWIERKIEGDRPKQQKLDKAPWSARKLWIKGSKHAVWGLFSLWTGFTFVGYFTPIAELGREVMTLSLGPWEIFWIFFYGLATYGNAGWLREQVCLYMCPYARFQSAMFDNDTLVIAYDEQRGEPRGSRKRGAGHEGLGDCVNCTMCVQVCPTGIDIRDGLQYQCIACAACVDVCDSVMDKVGYAKGLIRYTTENSVAGKVSHPLRPRMVVYGVLLLGLTALFGVSLGLRTPVQLDVLRDRNALYRETDAGLIENVYTLKLINMDDDPHRYRFSVSGLDGLTLSLDGGDQAVASGVVASIAARVSVDPVGLERPGNDIVFTVVATDDPDLTATEDARFLGPRTR